MYAINYAITLNLILNANILFFNEIKDLLFFLNLLKHFLYICVYITTKHYLKMRKMRLLLIALLLTVSGFAQDETISVDFAGLGYFRDFKVSDLPKGVMIPERDDVLIVNAVLDEYGWEIEDFNLYGKSDLLLVATKKGFMLIGASWAKKNGVKVGDKYIATVPFDSKKHRVKKHLVKYE